MSSRLPEAVRVITRSQYSKARESNPGLPSGEPVPYLSAMPTTIIRDMASFALHSSANELTGRIPL